MSIKTTSVRAILFSHACVLSSHLRENFDYDNDNNYGTIVRFCVFMYCVLYIVRRF